MAYEDILIIYDKYIVIIDQGIPYRSIVENPCIRLTTLAGIPELKATFERYRLVYMGEPLGSNIPEVV